MNAPTAIVPAPPGTPAPADPFTEYVAFDIVRMFTFVGALLLAVLVIRLLVLRLRRRADMGVHWLTYLSFAGLLALAAARRLERLGQPDDWYLWASTAAILAGITGVTLRVYDLRGATRTVLRPRRHR